jgi:hypothetical protein
VSRVALAALVAGCASSPAPESGCQFIASIGWTSQDTPEITSVTIGDVAVDDGVQFAIDERFASYEDVILERDEFGISKYPMGTIQFAALCADCDVAGGGGYGWCTRAAGSSAD